MIWPPVSRHLVIDRIPVARHARLRRRQAGMHAGMCIVLERLFDEPTSAIVVGVLQGVHNVVVRHQSPGRRSFSSGAVDIIVWAGKIGGARSSGASWPANHMARDPKAANAYARAWHALDAFGWRRFDELVIQLRRLPEGEHDFVFKFPDSGEIQKLQVDLQHSGSEGVQQAEMLPAVEAFPLRVD